MKKILVTLLAAVLLLSVVGCNKTPPEVPDNTDKETSTVEKQLLSYDNYTVFEDEIYLCDDVYRSDDTPTHGTGSIALPMGQDTLEVKDYDILLCGDGCPPESVLSRAAQGYAPAYRIVSDGEIDGNFKVLKFKMEIPEAMLEDIKKQGVYEQITEEIESQYYYLLLLNDKHYAYIHLERIEGAEKLEHEAELADSIVKNARVTYEPKNEKLDLTIERVIRLAENRGEELTWSDFQMYNAVETGSGLYILVYEIDEAFDLMIGGSSPVSSPMYIRLVTKADRDNYIDIRTENVEKFISENRNRIQIGAYIVSPTGESIKVRDIDKFKEYTVSLSFCIDPPPKEGGFYWIGGILNNSNNHITVDLPENFYPPQQNERTDGFDYVLSAYAVDATDSGVTVRFETKQAPQTGHLQTGEWYEIDRYVNDKWEPLNTVVSDYGFDDLAYKINEDETTEFKIEWEWLYGRLSPGHYRIRKEVVHFSETENLDKKIYSACFVIPDNYQDNNTQSKGIVYSRVNEISALPQEKANAIITGHTVGGLVEFYCFTPGLKYYRYEKGIEKFYECEVYLPYIYTDGEIIHIRPGAGSGEIEILMRATDESGKTIYPAYMFAAPVDPLNSQPSTRAIYDEQDLIDNGINTELVCSYPTALYFKTKNFLEEEYHRVFDPYYDIQSLTISNWQQNGNEATFHYKMTHTYYNKDPDTVDYIKKAKEEDTERYEKLYNDYLAEKEANVEYKVVLNDDNLELYSNVSPKGVEWQPVKVDDYILSNN